MKFRGKVWKFGDNVDTDAIIPARYLNITDPAELALHCMEDVDPDFAGKVGSGDIISPVRISAAALRGSTPRSRSRRPAYRA